MVRRVTVLLADHTVVLLYFLSLGTLTVPVRLTTVSAAKGASSVPGTVQRLTLRAGGVRAGDKRVYGVGVRGVMPRDFVLDRTKELTGGLVENSDSLHPIIREAYNQKRSWALQVRLKLKFSGVDVNRSKVDFACNLGREFVVRWHTRDNVDVVEGCDGSADSFFIGVGDQVQVLPNLSRELERGAREVMVL